jgi:hypothetical protein
MFAMGIDKMDLISGEKRYFDFEMVFKFEKRKFVIPKNNDPTNPTDPTDQTGGDQTPSEDDYAQDEEFDMSDFDMSDFSDWFDEGDFNFDDYFYDDSANVSTSYLKVGASEGKNLLKPCDRTIWK